MNELPHRHRGWPWNVPNIQGVGSSSHGKTDSAAQVSWLSVLHVKAHFPAWHGWEVEDHSRSKPVRALGSLGVSLAVTQPPLPCIFTMIECAAADPHNCQWVLHRHLHIYIPFPKMCLLGICYSPGKLNNTFECENLQWCGMNLSYKIIKYIIELKS